MASDILKTYAHHAPDEDALLTIRTLRQAYSKLHQTVLDCVVESRERSVALTNLEQSAMWAIKGVVCNDPDSKIEQPHTPPTPGDMPHVPG